MNSIEWCILLAALGLLWTQSHGLKCRTDDDEEDDDFNEVARMCMRNISAWDSPSSNNRYSTRKNDNNGSNNRNYGNRDNSNGNGCGDSNNNNDGSSRNNRNNNRNNNNNDGSNRNNNNNNNNGGRNSGDNGGSSWSYGGGWQQSSSNRGSSQSGGSSDYDYYSSRYRKSKNSSDRGRNNGNSWSSNNNKNYSMELSGNSPLEHVEPCIIHCIFSEMQMLDDAGYPEKSSVKNIMTRKIRNSEVRDFIEDSIDECYDLLDTGNRRDRCEYSKTLALCLEEKGRKTCEDWDAPNSGG